MIFISCWPKKSFYLSCGLFQKFKFASDHPVTEHYFQSMEWTLMSSQNQHLNLDKKTVLKISNWPLVWLIRVDPSLPYVEKICVMLSVLGNVALCLHRFKCPRAPSCDICMEQIYRVRNGILCKLNCLLLSIINTLQP